MTKTIAQSLGLLLLLCGTSLFAQLEPRTPFENGNGNQSATYAEVIAFYKQLQTEVPDKVHVVEYENGTDAGEPLHLVLITSDGGNWHPVPFRKKDKRFVFINNGIHPGEPCGIDASMILARDLAKDRIYQSLLDHIVVCIIPVYNVGGALNRNSTSRTNQTGPEAYGFRGNARNLDLNRDFIKADSRNARAFARIFHEWMPDLFVDTHTSNGADYQYRMTYLATQKDKLQPVLSQYMTQQLIPNMEKAMQDAEYEMCPYVQSKSWGMPPDSGLVAFMDYPRYSSGYASLFNVINFTTETHMLKPFEDRVFGTYHFLLNLLKFVNRDRKYIARFRKEADAAIQAQTEFPLTWELNTNAKRMITFKGYTAGTKTSQVTGKPRLYYDREAPFTKEIPYFDTYRSVKRVNKPAAYIIPQAWKQVIDRLKDNKVVMKRLSKDIDLEVETYYIDSYESRKEPYEGHYLHYNIKLDKVKQSRKFRQGDYVIVPDQVRNRYIVESLEPEADDSFFNWNFFDSILMRKEYFSTYVFEDEAAQLLESNPEWKQEMQTRMAQDSAFAANSWAQLDYIYRRSDHYEVTHKRYPVARLLSPTKLPLMK